MTWEVECVHDAKSEAFPAKHDSYDAHGNHYVSDYDENWIGCLAADHELKWSVGPQDVPAYVTANSRHHIVAPLSGPAHVKGFPDGSVVVTSFFSKHLHRIDPETSAVTLVIDAPDVGMADIGYSELDDEGSIWVAEITGCRIWQFTADGEPARTIGTGQPGFQLESVPLSKAQFNWIYDIRMGPDGNLYVLDSKNYAVRVIDLKQDEVRRVAGCGRPGYTGDGGDPLDANFGSNAQSPDKRHDAATFDGPWAISLDEQGNVFVGDTHNHVVRMVDRGANKIATISGRYECDYGVRNKLPSRARAPEKAPAVAGDDGERTAGTENQRRPAVLVQRFRAIRRRHVSEPQVKA